MRRPVVTVTILRAGGGRLIRTFALTPYDMEVAADDARRGGTARLEASVDGGAGALAAVEHAFAMVVSRGVRVSIDRARATSKGGGRCPEAIP